MAVVAVVPSRKMRAESLPERPNHAYYRSLHGRWRSPFQFLVTDWRAFWSCPMGWMDRLRVLATVLLPRLLGPLVVETNVDYRSKGEQQGEVIHELRVKKWGMTFFRSNESLLLHENGSDLTIRGEQRFWPTMWRSRDFGDSRGLVAERGTRATYSLQWLGTRMRQIGEIEEDAVRITMETDWARGVQLLRRMVTGPVASNGPARPG